MRYIRLTILAYFFMDTVNWQVLWGIYNSLFICLDLVILVLTKEGFQKILSQIIFRLICYLLKLFDDKLAS